MPWIDDYLLVFTGVAAQRVHKTVIQPPQISISFDNPSATDQNAIEMSRAVTVS